MSWVAGTADVLDFVESSSATPPPQPPIEGLSRILSREIVVGTPDEAGKGRETVLVRVTDDGPGLPEQERAVLVAGEETSVVHGSGLGLWLVYWIVQRVEGELRVRDVAVGTCIEVRLPVAAGSPTEH